MGNLRMNADQISYKGADRPMSVEEAIKNAGNTGLAHTADIAPDFSTESAYSAGDFVYHNGTLYVFTSNHAAGAWSTSDTQAVTVGGEVATLSGDVADLGAVKANQITIAPSFSAETAYDPGDLVYYNGLSYRCVNSHEGAWDADDFAATTVANELGTLMSGLTDLNYCNILQAQPIYLAGSTDLNTITDVGVYGGNLYPSNLGHSPEPDNSNATYVKLIVSEIGLSNAKVLIQECHMMTTVGTMHVYTRYLSADTWTAWA